ncbi:MAG: hypothetical protein V4773_02570 [Verrucomicrobiota bacterium]
MSTRRKLDELKERKRLLEAKIALHRLECQLNGVQLAQPMAFVDRMHDKWTNISPWVKALGVPLGMLVMRQLKSKSRAGGKSALGGAAGTMGTIISLMPMAIQAWKGYQEVREQQREAAEAHAAGR